MAVKCRVHEPHEVTGTAAGIREVRSIWLLGPELAQPDNSFITVEVLDTDTLVAAEAKLVTAAVEESNRVLAVLAPGQTMARTRVVYPKLAKGS
ncbi:MAG: hypothetical protein M3Q74_13195 [Pseudomonadota bacterium]|nr:hypothetical protein [Pseudomonadota bacterium]